MLAAAAIPGQALTSQKDELTQFILRNCFFALEEVMNATDPRKHYPLPFSILSLFDTSPRLAHQLVMNPNSFYPVLNEAIVAAQKQLLCEKLAMATTDHFTFKSHVNARFTNFPAIAETTCSRIPTMTSGIGLLSLNGTVIRTGAPKMIEACRVFECARCRAAYTVAADDVQYGAIVKPMACDAVIDGQKCATSKFNTIENANNGSGMANADCRDYQEIRMQEPTNLLEIGAVPRSMVVILKDDLVDSCKAGDDVIIIGSLIKRWKPLRPETRFDIELAFIANNIHVVNQQRTDSLVSTELQATFQSFWQQHSNDPMNAQRQIISSFCPKIFGLALVKLAVVLTIISGHEPKEGGGKKGIRREGHILLVGDPGTAKSQFLVQAARLSMRAVMTTGSGSTNAGLTVAASKESGDWQLEAGAIVLADGGICCIDEFNAMRASDRTAIHEAMEQQTLSVAKAGLVCKLNTRCSVIAACNSKGKFEDGISISANTALSSPLLSRFDLILVLLDRHSEDWDRRLSQLVLNNACRSRSKHLPNNDSIWDFPTLKAYLHFVKHAFRPKLTSPAKLVLSKYYQFQRRADLRDVARTTIRLLESLVRLAQSHAKLMFRNKVTLQDAIVAVVLMEASLQAQSLLGMRSDLYQDFADDPEQEFNDYQRLVLQKLSINPKVLNEDSTESWHEEEGVDELEALLAADDDLLEGDKYPDDEPLCSWQPTQH